MPVTVDPASLASRNTNLPLSSVSMTCRPSARRIGPPVSRVASRRGSTSICSGGPAMRVAATPSTESTPSDTR